MPLKRQGARPFTTQWVVRAEESGQTSGRGETAAEQAAKGSTPDKKVPSQQVQQALIALDKQWGEAGSKGDTATLTDS